MIWCERNGVRFLDLITIPLPTCPSKLDLSNSVDITYRHDDCVKGVKMSPLEDSHDACILEEDDDNI